MKCELMVAMAVFTLVRAGTDCPRPELENGIVTGTSNGNMFVGKLSCNPGYHLMGNRVVKCRQGTWTNRIPVCIKIGTCPELPEIPNGSKVVVKGSRGSMFRIKCRAGFLRLGARRLYCTGNGWSAEMPICAKANCEADGMDNIEGGYSAKIMGGAMYRYQCTEGAEMTGSSAVYCDGSSWNDTAPTCLGAPGPVKVQTWVNGVETSHVKVGDFVTVTCSSNGGFPVPKISIFKNSELVADSDSMRKPYFTFAASARDNNADIVCFSKNKAADYPQEDHIKLTVTYMPEKLVLSGPSTMSEDEGASLTCTTSLSHPTPTILWKIIKVRGDEKEEQPLVVGDALNKEAKDGHVTLKSVLKVSDVGKDVDKVMVKCLARLDGMKDVQSELKNVDIRGPPGLPEMTGIQSGSSIPEGSHHMLTCRALAGKPAASVAWLKGGVVVRAVEWHTEDGEVVSQWRYKAEMGDTEIGCLVSNAVAKDPSITTIGVKVVQSEIDEPTEKLEVVEQVESEAMESEEMVEDTKSKKYTTEKTTYEKGTYKSRAFENEIEVSDNHHHMEEGDTLIESGDHQQNDKDEEENYELSKQEITNEMEVTQKNIDFKEENPTKKIKWIEAPIEVTEEYYNQYNDRHEDNDEEDEDYDEPMRAQQEVPVEVVNQKASQSLKAELQPQSLELSNNSSPMCNVSLSLMLFLAFISSSSLIQRLL